MGKYKYDVVIVGGGPAGLSAGIKLVEKGFKTLLIERGRFCGAKNLFGGIIYTSSIKEIVPEFPEVDNFPAERPVTEEGYFFISKDGVVKILHTKRDPKESYTALRAKFDAFLSDYAIKKGLDIAVKTRVLDLIWEANKVCGVIVDRPTSLEDKTPASIEAKVVVLAEGVNRVLTERAGLVDRTVEPSEVVLAVKEVLQLPKGEMEARLGLGENRGLAIELMGEVTLGLPGTGFLYTNKNTLSFGVGIFLNKLMDLNLKPYEILERAKALSYLRELFNGAETLEYGAHLIPEWGIKAFPKLFGNGVLVVGDAAGLVNPLFREGTNLAIYSGLMASEAIKFAFEKGDFTEKALKRYEELFKESYIYKDMLMIKDLKAILLSNSQLFQVYPELMYQICHLYFSAQGRAKRDVIREILAIIRRKRGLLGLVRDFLKLGRILW
ncbi:MAG: FAD-dependent oxidoreductase [Caldimicrobium sp.]|nr:FAD-dependent oxidoreductase [Caldimicrobium sp.]MDW8182892.1 FAD-dependent oxidoreductase [Caldimicrobium sp.]